MLYASGLHPRTEYSPYTVSIVHFWKATLRRRSSSIDQPCDRHASAYSLYSDVAVRPVLGTLQVGLVLIGTILLSAFLDFQARIPVVVPIKNSICSEMTE
jgi:hypothetical protein